MLRSILVPLDGSEFAENAIPLALNIATRAGAHLELLRVHELYACVIHTLAGRPTNRLRTLSIGPKSRHIWTGP